MENFFELLLNKGFIKKGAIQIKRFQEISFEEVMEISQLYIDLAKTAEVPHQPSPFVYSASLSLGGDRFPCSGYSCRKEYVHQLANFAILFSDKVYIRNILSDYVHHAKEMQQDETNKWKPRFCNDIAVLCYMQDLLTSGIIIPFSSEQKYCPSCLSAMVYGDGAEKRFKKEKNKLYDVVNGQLSGTIVKGEEEGTFLVNYKAPQSIVEHGSGRVRFYKDSPVISRIPLKIRQKVNEGKEIELSKENIIRMGLGKGIADEILRNITFELVTARELKTVFLTERSLHAEILNSLSNDKSIVRRNALSLKYLSSEVPYFNELPIKDILKLRKREAEAFTVYRDALGKAINEYKQLNSKITDREARFIYSDIIEPKLNILNNKVSNAKKDLYKHVYRTGLAWTAAITFGVYNNLVSSLGGLATLVGMGVAAKQMYDLMKQSDAEQAIKNDEMYFLWKIQQISRNKRNSIKRN